LGKERTEIKEITQERLRKDSIVTRLMRRER